MCFDFHTNIEKEFILQLVLDQNNRKQTIIFSGLKQVAK
jgi:hypothetical protein